MENKTKVELQEYTKPELVVLAASETESSKVRRPHAEGGFWIFSRGPAS